MCNSDHDKTLRAIHKILILIAIILIIITIIILGLGCVELYMGLVG
jgi:hypothetical protein